MVAFALLGSRQATAQALIKVNDDVSFKLGFLLQGQADEIRYDGGTFLPVLPKQDALYGEAGYDWSKAKLMAYGTWARKDLAGTDVGDETRWSAGLAVFPAGHNFNIKAASGRIDPKGGKRADQYTIQLQAFYF